MYAVTGFFFQRVRERPERVPLNVYAIRPTSVPLKKKKIKTQRDREARNFFNKSIQRAPLYGRSSHGDSSRRPRDKNGMQLVRPVEFPISPPRPSSDRPHEIILHFNYGRITIQ